MSEFALTVAVDLCTSQLLKWEMVAIVILMGFEKCWACIAVPSKDLASPKATQLVS